MSDRFNSPASDQPDADAVRLPITGELDLHTFRPNEVAALLEDYFAECVRVGIFSVRIVHGKGTGALRETVHALLRRSSRVASFRLGDETSGSWGATIATLRREVP
ncbi:MAG TPA: Smr/MutS family protein [Acidobacteriota bacterium]|nr:Smr/MutS family protein [Acidobacteriota bacterium]